MKKWMSILLAALLACMCAAGVAEADALPDDVIDAFVDTWLSQSEEIGAAVEIWIEDGAFYCSGNCPLDAAGDEDYRWEYDDCHYDAESGVLVCEGGVRTRNHFDSDALELFTDETLTGLSATFTPDGDRLIWRDSEGIMDDVVLLHLSDAEDLMGEHAPESDSLRYDGTWVCDRATIEISAEDAGYKCSISWAGSAWEEAQWEYACMYDAESGALVDGGMGVKSVVTYAEDGEIASVEEIYNNGAATFTIGEDELLTWQDAVEDAGADMTFRRAERYAFEEGFDHDDSVNSFIDGDGHFIIQIPVAEDDAGEWHADDMSQDDSVVKLYYADTLEDTFVANYEPVGDGAMTVATRHFDGIACDEVYTWNLAVADGKVTEAFGGSWKTSPDEADQDADIVGEWIEPGEGLCALTVERNPEKGWDATAVVVGSRDAHLFRMNIRYDCELDAFVYADGQMFETAVGEDDTVETGAPLRDDLTGSIRFVEDDDGQIALNWYNDLSPEEDVQFVRAQSDGGNEELGNRE